MPDLIRHPGSLWTPAFAGVTNGGDLSYIIAGVIKTQKLTIGKGIWVNLNGRKECTCCIERFTCDHLRGSIPLRRIWRLVAEISRIVYFA
jgi:hypothetical protein